MEKQILTSVIIMAGMSIILGMLLARYVTGPWLHERLSWGTSLLLSVVPILCGFAVMIAFSSKAPESTFFTILPVLIYFLATTVLAKLFVKKGDEFGSGMAESVLFGFVQSVGTILTSMFFLFVLFVIAWAVRRP